MVEDADVSPVAIDLTRLHRRTLTSFYSNLVTRPTGRAVRMGVESQLADLDAKACLSVLDFSQVHVLDYSCADEIVAKLLLRFVGDDRPADAFFLARGLREHHLEAVEAVLERHNLLLVAEAERGPTRLLGPSSAFERSPKKRTRRYRRLRSPGCWLRTRPSCPSSSPHTTKRPSWRIDAFP